MGELDWAAKRWPLWRRVLSALGFALGVLGLFAQIVQARYAWEAGDEVRAIAILVTLAVIVPATTILIVWYYRRNKRLIEESRSRETDESKS